MLMPKAVRPLLALALFCVIAAPSLEAAIPAGQAVKRAVNEIRSSALGVTLSHPQYDAVWTAGGLAVAAKKGPSWRWELASVRLGSDNLDVNRAAKPRVASNLEHVDYARGAVIERYVVRRDSVEQQFVLPGRLAAAGDLLIEGNIASSGSFAITERGWVWSDSRGVISLGKLTVFDANGTTLPSRMIVSADRVRFIVDGGALATAAYPVTLDPVIGTNDFRISNVGTDGMPSTGSAYAPAAAYDSNNNQYLVVWQQYDGTENEIYGQFIDGSTGAEAGSDFRISDMGPNGTPNANYNAANPAIVYNSTSSEFLVVWQADDNTPPLINDEVEIFGRRISGGSPIGDDFRISNMGVDANVSSGAASYGKVAWNNTNNEYLVIWVGTDGNGETEIRGQRISGTTGLEVGSQLTFSSIGPSSPNPGFLDRSPTNHPDVAYNATDNTYLVVWAGDGLATDNENEIFGQRVGATGTELGSDFQISTMGPNGDQNYVAYNVAVAWNSVDNQYLVVWNGTDDTAPLVQFEHEIFGRRINANTGALLGTDHIRISNAGTNGDTAREALDPDVAYSAPANEYLVAWRADGGATNDELEIWAQRIDSDGTEIGGDVRLSDMGPDGDTNYRPFSQQIAPAGATFLIVWFSDDNSGTLVDDENEIFGQFFAASASLTSTMLDDFSVNQGPLTLGAIIGTVTDHNADSAAIHGGERNLRISGNNVGGDPITLSVSGGVLNLNRPATSSGELAVWWDGDNDTDSFDANTSLPYDLTSGATLDSFRIAVTSSSSSSQEMRIYVYTTGSSVSRIHFTLPTGGGNVDLLFSNFITASTLPADFSAIRAIYMATVTNTPGYTASIDSIRVRNSNFTAPATLTATATSASAVGLTWSAAAGASSYEIWRSTLGAAYSLLTTTPTTTLSDLGLTANRTYLYKVRAVSASETSNFGPVDAATTIIFTDPTLNNTIQIKAVHFTQLRTAVNAMQTAAAQTPTAFPETITAGVTTVKGSHVAELRAALDSARTQIGLAPISYIDPIIINGTTTAKAVHVTELRNGTQ